MDEWQVFEVVVFIALLIVAAINTFSLFRKKMAPNSMRPLDYGSVSPSPEETKTPLGGPAEPVPGMVATGELTVGAKYAIWNYMFSILAIGGTVIGIVSGIAGYLVNDLARGNAVQKALNAVQEPLMKELKDLADAQSALKAAIEQVKNKDEGFTAAVAASLSSRGVFQVRVATALRDDDAFRTSLAAQLAAKHRDELRGEVGPAGKDGPAGPPGKDGASPTPASIGLALRDDDAFRTSLAAQLAAKHRDQLRGEVGPAGKDGPAGPPGKDGASPTPASIGVALRDDDAFRTSLAAQLAAKHRDQLRGEVGPAGKDGPAGPPGKDGASPTPASIGVALRDDDAFRTGLAAQLAAKHRDQLRGEVGPAGKDGPAGPPGKDGASPTPASIGVALRDDDAFRTSLAAQLAAKHRDQLRGEVGPAGKDGPAGPPGKDGASPTPASIGVALRDDDAFRTSLAAQLAAKHRDQLRGEVGPAGKDGPVGPPGKDGASPTPASIGVALRDDDAFRTSLAAQLAAKHRDQLRGEVGPAGKDGPVGPPGKDGASPTPASIGVALRDDDAFRTSLAAQLAAKHRDQLRGEVGPAGKDGPVGPPGKDGASPTPASIGVALRDDDAFRTSLAAQLTENIAMNLITKHSAELRRILRRR